MTDNLASLLRGCACSHCVHNPFTSFHHEAADEIERLRAALDKICGVALGCRQDPDFPAAKIHRMVLEALSRR